MIDNIIEVENLKKYYPIKKGVFSKTVGNVRAVDNVSFHIRKGEILGIVGESGCGKSTTGRTILNLIEPTGGRVKFNGEVIFDIENNERMNRNKMMEIRKDMQIIFQDPFACLDPRMKIQSIITEGLKKHNIAKGKEAKEQAEELLELCGLDRKNIDKYPHEFSGGQRQRIGIARALSLNPKFIVCDEPTAALDVSIQSQVLNLMLELKEERDLSYLFISHDLSVVKNFCDRIGVMYLGSIVETGESKELFNNPLHPYTKALLSAVPSFNSRDRKKNHLISGDVPSPANPPNGCRFHTRCSYAMDKCKIEMPKLRNISEGHAVACHLV